MPADRIEPVRANRLSRDDMVRHWQGDVVVAATCRYCGLLTPADRLRASARSRGGLALECKACNSERARPHNKRWASENKEKKSEGDKAYRRAQGEALRKKKRQAAALDRERVRAKARAERDVRLARTPEQLAADLARFRPDGVKKCGRCHVIFPVSDFHRSRGNSDGIQSACRRCNGKSGRLRQLARRRPGFKPECFYCGGAFEDVDHVVPKARGGTDDVDNLVPACGLCNGSKGAKLYPTEWSGRAG